MKLEFVRLIEFAAKVPLLTVNDWPLPTFTAPVTVRLPVAKTRFPDVSVRLLIETVFVGPLIVVPAAAFNVTSSLIPGTIPVLQFAATPQLCPSPEPTQETADNIRRGSRYSTHVGTRDVCSRWRRDILTTRRKERRSRNLASQQITIEKPLFFGEAINFSGVQGH